MEIYVTPDFLVGVSIFIDAIAFIIGFFIGAWLFSNNK